MNTLQKYLLVVEDIPDILKLLEATLVFKGYRVVTAPNGQEALEIIQKEHPAVIITDILMPKMDGFSLVHRLRINPETRDIPVVFLSATYVAPEDKAFAIAIGATRFLEKPVALEEFLPTVEELLTKGAPAGPELVNEFDFYDGYRKRLETKLNHKITQIARDEHLVKTLPELEKASFEASLRLAIEERKEIELLLTQIRLQLEKLSKPES
ncbi:MAG: response regulator [Anaerolineales bacterium]|jgi:CheY-like chemotaxis protein|uniref:response regulator n=1 Tax=Candidatus Villigracilis affinis TaxID=3140682 RepID=UPI002A1DF89A|nr:response regulator [Anaerolineales bacterium]MBL0348623.1 response regulator [Anaerolineales bacterium]